MNKIVFILLFSTGCFFYSSAQYITAAQYIQDHKDMAMREMKRMGVPAAITLAQGLLETENGNSVLVKKSNNHFGIKCKSTWTAASVTHDDDAPGECFRLYKDADESYRDHSNFLRGNDRYAFLFKLDPTDYKGWAYGLRKAGYATNPRYPDILIKYIETNNLQQYTLEGAGDVAVFDASKFKDDPEEKPIPAEEVTASEAPGQVLNAGTRLSVNGSLALFVTKGTSLLAIATQYKINLSKLLEMNDLKKDGLLEKEQFIFLEKKQKEGDREYCIAQPNETLYDISQKNGVVLQSLYAFNQMSENDFLVAGTKIFLKPQAVVVKQNNPAPVNSVGEVKTIAAASPASSTNNSKVQMHQVQPKEGLYSISKKYGVTIEKIKEWNDLQSDQLQIGQQLIISK